MAILNEFPSWDTSTFAERLTGAGKQIVITTSEDDRTNPPVMQRWWAAQLPGAQLLHCRVGFGHLHAVDTGVNDELLRRMMGMAPNPNFQAVS